MLDGRELTFFRCAQADLLPRVGAMAHAAEHLLAREVQLYRATGFLCRNRAHNRMRPDESFASKAAADKRRDDMDSFLGNAQRLCHGVTCAYNPLRGLPQSQVVAIPCR